MFDDTAGFMSRWSLSRRMEDAEVPFFCWRTLTFLQILDTIQKNLLLLGLLLVHDSFRKVTVWSFSPQFAHFVLAVPQKLINALFNLNAPFTLPNACESWFRKCLPIQLGPRPVLTRCCWGTSSLWCNSGTWLMDGTRRRGCTCHLSASRSRNHCNDPNRGEQTQLRNHRGSRDRQEAATHVSDAVV